MRRKKIMAWMLSMVMAFTVFGATGTSAFAAEGTMSGEGTEDSPYLIEDAADFAAIGAEVEGAVKYKADAVYQLDSDITVTTPCATEFKGVLEGNGHTVTLAIESSAPNTGLFQKLGAGAVISDLITEGTVTVSGNKSYTGAIVGFANGNGGEIIIENCMNSADVTGYKAVGGIAGYTANNVTITRCANAGTITASNMQVAGIDGNAASGVTTITNCYNRGDITGFNYSGGIIGQATKSSAQETVENCYSTGLSKGTSEYSPTPGALIGLSSTKGTVNNCYALEGIVNPVAEGKDGLIGTNNAAVTNTSYKTEAEMKSADFVNTLNGEGEAFAADTDEINDGYPVLAWQQDEEPAVDPEDQAIADAIAAKFNGEMGALRPASGTDTNIADFVEAKAKAYTSIENMDPEEVSVSLKSSDDTDYIAEDGTITYVKRDALNAYNYVQNISCVFTIEYGTATADTASRTVTIGWDRAAFYEKMQEEAQQLTADTIKGENESLEAVTEELSLPQCMGTSARSVWSTIEWTSSNTDVIDFQEVEYSGVTTPLRGIVTPAAEDTTVTLTATFKANDTILNSNVEKVADFGTIEKTFEVTVPGSGPVGPTEEELQAILDQYYTADMLQKFEDKSALDPSKVEGDIQLPLYTRIKDADDNPVFENHEIEVVSSDESVVKINGYRALVDRFQDSNKDVELTIKFTRNNITVQKTIPLTVIAITDAELDAEIKALETVKEHYFDGINDGKYADKDSVTGNLHAFQEANVDENGNISWVYNYDDMTNAGIVPDGYFEDSVEMEAAGYNRFKSSNNDVIQHENLVLNMPEKDTEVTITSWLSSERYGDYAPQHPDNAKLQKLYKQEVSVTVTVKTPHVHKLVHYDAKAATKDQAGNIEYWMCTECGKYFTDEEGNNEVTEADVVIPKTGKDPAAKGTKLSHSTGTYVVTSAAAKSPTVALNKAAKKATISVPATVTIGGVKYKVTAISAKAFKGNTKVKKVTIESNVKTIGANAFNGCKKLTSVKIGKAVTKIGANSFKGAKKLKTIVVTTKKLKKAGVKNSLKGSSVKTVKVSLGKKSVNKTYVKKYKKIFTKKNCGRTVTVK